MNAQRLPRRSGQRGVALLLVLWACTLLAIVLGGYAALARTEALQARYTFARTQAHYAAQAGLMQAVYGLHNPSPRQRWVGDGRPYTFHYNDATVTIHAVDEGGKVDLNSATPEVLQGLLLAVGMQPDQAQRLTANVVDWRTFVGPDGKLSGRLQYQAAGREYGPRHAPFVTIEELQMVLGMTPQLYRKLAPLLTIWSGAEIPDPNTAPPLVLAAIPGMTPARRQTIEAARRNNARGNDPDDASLVVGDGTTHSIQAEAVRADGTRATLRATIRWQPGGDQAQPYTVLRWQEGTTE